jgi:O-antigen/teichoic acid export membrane protein
MDISNRVKELFKNKIFLSSSFLAAVSFLSGIMNFVFNLIVGRVLGPDEFGIVYPLTALLMIISIPSKAIQTVTTDEVSMLLADKNHGKIKALYPKIVLSVLVITVGFIGLLLLCLPFLKGLLHIDNISALMITVASVFVTTVYIPFYSLTQSRERFFVAGLTQILGTIGKFAVGIGIVVTVKSYFGALWGNFAGSVVMMIVLVIDMFTFKPLFDKQVENVYDGPRRKEILNSFLYSFLLSARSS